MPQGMLGNLPPGLRGYVLGQQMNQQKEAQAFQMAGMLAQLQNQAADRGMKEQLFPLQLQEHQAKIDATNQRQGMLQQFAAQLPENERAAFILSPDTFLKEKFAAYNLRPGETRMRGTEQVASAPALPTLQQLPVPGQPGVSQPTWLRPGEATGTPVGGMKMPEILNPAVQEARTNVARAGAPRVTVPVNVSTEKKYGEQFASKLADADLAMRDSALKAPDLAERANMVRQTLASGKVVTGFGADFRLQLGKAMGLVGASDRETIANTETLATQLAQNTLDAIKASGLGGGTGFSNADRDFLEKAVGGKISLERETIARLADLSHRAATKSTERWNERVKRIPASALEGTGIEATPVTVPPSPRRRASDAPKAGAVQDGYRFKGGNPADPKNWEKQ